MKRVVQSTTEAEYMALSQVVKELKFIVQPLQTMDITVELPITLHVDKVEQYGSQTTEIQETEQST